jgi:hypothetical protein
MIGAAIYIFVVGICLWELCHQTKEIPTLTPSAPQMPMLAIAPQPAVAPRTAPTPFQKSATNNRSIPSHNAIPINITITLEASRHFTKEETLKKGEISNQYICKFCKFLIKLMPSTILSYT